MSVAHRAPALDQLVVQVNEAYPGRKKTLDGWIGDAAHADRKSDHNPNWNDGGVVRAQDIDADLAGGDSMALAVALATDDRVSYVIHRGRIGTPRTGWSDYTGTNPHNTHIHVSVTEPGGYSERRWTLALAFTLLYPHKNGRLTSPYGPRRLYLNGKWVEYIHRGADIAPRIAGTVGEPVYAPCDMAIRKVVSGRKAGQPASNTTGGSLAAHMSGNGVLGTPEFGPFDTVAMGHFKPSVPFGKTVKQGDIIGRGDLSGDITGPHVHLELWTTLNPSTHINPGPYLVKIVPEPKPPITPPITPGDWFDMATKQDLIDALAPSLEIEQRNTLIEYYVLLLGREPSPADLEFRMKALKNGNSLAAQYEAIHGSQEGIAYRKKSGR